MDTEKTTLSRNLCPRKQNAGDGTTNELASHGDAGRPADASLARRTLLPISLCSRDLRGSFPSVRRSYPNLNPALSLIDPHRSINIDGHHSPDRGE